MIGPRQVGKTTLALAEGAVRDAVYLDLESPKDLAKLQDPELYLSEHLGRLVILDEVHRAPGLFPVLRGLIDRARREGRRSGLYLLLGSASLDLLKQSGETLAGRVSFLELSPFNLAEAAELPGGIDRLWVRGGFPESYLSEREERSARWREDFIKTYLERDIPRFGPSLGSETMRRLWTMLAHDQGGLLNAALLARNIGIDVRTANRYTDLLEALLLLRRLPAWHSNVGKRLVKSPKTYIRDSGILHALLGIENKEALLSHPVVGSSWEGFSIEQILTSVPGVQGYFYRAGGGAELDLIVAWPDGRLWAVEIKRSLSPRPEKGFFAACEDINPERKYIVYPGEETYPISKDITVLPLRTLIAKAREKT